MRGRVTHDAVLLKINLIKVDLVDYFDFYLVQEGYHNL